MDIPLGTRVRALRRQQDLTQHQLAELAHMNPITISRLEHGNSEHVYARTVRDLALALGCTADYLLGLRTAEEEEVDRDAQWWAVKKAEYHTMSRAERSARVEKIALAPTPPSKEGTP